MPSNTHWGPAYRAATVENIVAKLEGTANTRAVLLVAHYDDKDWINIIGVVKDVRQIELTADPKPQAYLTYLQFGFFDSRDLKPQACRNPFALTP